MDKQTEKKINSFPHVRAMFRRLPRDIWYIFMPESFGQMVALEANLRYLKVWEKERNQVMSVQHSYNLPLRPNQRMQELYSITRIEELRENKWRGKPSDRGTEK